MLIQTFFEDEKLFVEIFEPYEYEDFIAAAAEEFNIDNPEDIILTVNGTRVKSSQFKSIVLQYFKVPTFHMDLTIKDTGLCASSAGSSIASPGQQWKNGSGQLPYHSNSTTESLPSLAAIKSLISVQISLINVKKGLPLRNNDRVKIAKEIIEECLKDNPNRTLIRDDFQYLSQAIVAIFDTELASAYFMPSIKGQPSRGKLWSAYNNKRAVLSQLGVIHRRSKPRWKRKASTSPTLELVPEGIQCLQENSSDWTNILEKWSETHKFRMNELKCGMSTNDYLHKYPGLKESKGVELASLDVQMLYPTVGTVDNWLTMYPKVISRARIKRDKNLMQVIAEIDKSQDERFKAQMALMCIPYILPHCGKRSETPTKANASKSEIQQRFMKDYKTLSELEEDPEAIDLQIRFVIDATNSAITYADFTIAGYTFKCSDLMEALNIGYMYIMALHVSFPKLSSHVWQFVQLSIFKTQLSETKAPNIETAINDLFNEASPHTHNFIPNIS